MAAGRQAWAAQELSPGSTVTSGGPAQPVKKGARGQAGCVSLGLRGSIQA